MFPQEKEIWYEDLEVDENNILTSEPQNGFQEGKCGLKQFDRYNGLIILCKKTLIGV
jgi:hypothetical protein